MTLPRGQYPVIASISNTLAPPRAKTSPPNQPTTQVIANQSRWSPASLKRTLPLCSRCPRQWLGLQSPYKHAKTKQHNRSQVSTTCLMPYAVPHPWQYTCRTPACTPCRTPACTPRDPYPYLIIVKWNPCPLTMEPLPIVISRNPCPPIELLPIVPTEPLPVTKTNDHHAKRIRWWNRLQGTYMVTSYV